MYETGWTILVVDDEAVNVKVLQTLLNQAGFSVLTAKNGPQARQIASEQLPDLILLDIMMPGESGFETCTALQSDSRTADIPIIFLSALDNAEDKVKGFRVGGVDYVAKPFHKEELMARVKTHLRLRHAFAQIIAEQARRLEEVKQGQQNLLVQPEQDPEAQYGVHYAPMYEAGGDFYDVFHFNAETYVYFLGDISGHDLSTSMVTSAVKALVREYCSPLYTPEEGLNHINTILRRSFFQDGKHMTAVMALVNRRKHTLELLSAGHTPALYLPQNGPPQVLETRGDVLGIFDHIHVDTLRMPLAAGDRIVLYSDGLIEYGSQDGDRDAGLQTLLAACETMRQHTIQVAVHELVETVLENGGVPVQDDIVALGVEV